MRELSNSNVMGSPGLEKSVYRTSESAQEMAASNESTKLSLSEIKEQALKVKPDTRRGPPLELVVTQQGDQLVSNGMLLYKAMIEGREMAIMAFPSHGIPVKDKTSVDIQVNSPTSSSNESLKAEVIFDNPGEDIVIVAVPVKKESWLEKSESANLWNLSKTTQSSGSLYQAPSAELSESMQLKSSMAHSEKLEGVGIEMRCLDDGKMVDLSERHQGEKAQIRISQKDLNPPLLRWAYEVNLPVKHGMSGCPVYWSETNQFIGMLFQHGVGTQNAFIIPADVVRASFCEGLKRVSAKNGDKPKAQSEIDEVNAHGCVAIGEKLDLRTAKINDLSLETSEKISGSSLESFDPTSWQALRSAADGHTTWNSNNINRPERIFVLPKNELRSQEIIFREPSEKLSFLISRSKASDVTGKRPGDVTGKRPGDVTGKRPGDVTGKRPGDVTGKRPGDVTGKRPGDVTGKRPGDVSSDDSDLASNFVADGIEIEMNGDNSNCHFTYISPYDDVKQIGNINELLKNYYSGGTWGSQYFADLATTEALAKSSLEIKMNEEVFNQVFASKYQIKEDFRSGIFRFSPITEEEYQQGVNDFDNFTLDKAVKTSLQKIEQQKGEITWSLTSGGQSEDLTFSLKEGSVSLESKQEDGKKFNWVPVGPSTKEIRNFVFYNPQTKEYLELSHSNLGTDGKSMRMIRSHYQNGDEGTLIRESIFLKASP